MFTDVDKEFCSSLGIEPVNDPEAFQLVDEKTLLFAIHMELETYNSALAKLPAIYIGSHAEQFRNVGRSEEELARLSAMHDASDAYDFPDRDVVFHSTVMYWRRGGS